MQKTLFSFFNKAPKSQSQASEANVERGKSSSGAQQKAEGDGRFPAGSLVWSKLPGYPWWPSMVCKHPTSGKTTRKGEIHVQFLDTPVTRSWVSISMIKRWGEKVVKEGGPGLASWEAGVKQAEKTAELSNEERLDTLLVTLLPSDEEEEWSDEEVSPGSKENKKNTDEPLKKRRRILMVDSDDSDGDENFTPSKAELDDHEEEDESSGDSEAEPTTGEDEPASSPVKGSKKRKIATKASQKNKKGRTSPEGDSSLLATPVGKFVSSLVNSSSSGRKSPLSHSSLSSPGVSDSTKKKLAMFGASGDSSAVQYSHTNLAFLKPENIRDADKRPRDHPDYNSRTLYVPHDFLSAQTPAQRQWWELKSSHYDVILFFKMGKFYELFHMDADVGVAELNLIYMKGNVAHAGFPEVAFSRYGSTLVEKGYKVARIEQTETPAMMEERVKKLKTKSKFDKVVEREVCQVMTKGTRVNTFMDRDDFQGEPSYLLAIVEKPAGRFGVAFIDTTLGCFNLSQFTDDKNLSRLRTLAAHYPPSEVLFSRGSLSSQVETFLQSSLSAARKESLRPGVEFWDAAKTLKVLAEGEYFMEAGSLVWPEVLVSYQEQTDSLGLTANTEGELAISALGALVWYLSKGFLDQQLLSQRKFSDYKPVDMISGRENAGSEGDAAAPSGKYMVLDGVTVKNLELVANTSTGGREGTLVARVDSCNSAMGKRTLRHWILCPLLQVPAIMARQEAVKQLMEFSGLQEVKKILQKLPDLERLLSKIHSAGDAIKSKNHPDSRAVFFENHIYSKRKILDLLSCLDGLKKCNSMLKLFSEERFESKVLKNITTLETEGGEFPNLSNLFQYFDNAFDHDSAKKEGKIVPSKGVDSDLDEADDNIAEITEEMKDYLREQKKHFGCEVKYWGTGKNRFQLEVPVGKQSKAGNDYELASGTKNVKRYVTSETKQFLERQIAAEDQREKALMDIQRKLFEQFSKHADVWKKAISCVAFLDALISLATYSNSVETGCFPTLLTDFSNPVIDIKEGRHPCLDNTGIAYIPNDTLVGGDSRLMILTGPNMGGKSTLMRQTGLLVILSQLGCMVPAEEMSLTPVDRVFTRLGASDNIFGGESTFLVELQETGAILSHSTLHSLVLIGDYFLIDFHYEIY